MSEIMVNERENSENEHNKTEKKTLYLVATPIGNLDDITYRAVKVLSEVDFIAAEDTRNTPKLLEKYGIKKPLVSYFEHNKRERGEYIVSRIEAGESCALVTDAGTPAISDPGKDLVVLCRQRGVAVTGIPGACAAINALTLSSLPSVQFCFEGFLTTNKSQRRERLEFLKRETRTLIIYEAPHRIVDTVSELLNCFGDRKISVCRELTKINEQVYETTLSGAVGYYKSKQPKGEYVLIIEGAPPAQNDFFADMTVLEHVDFYEKQGMSRMDAIKAAAKDRGVGKSEIYKVITESKS